jgi:D-alanine-D-alanine ligase
MIAVAFGGPSPEHDVSILTGLQASRALHTAGRQVAALYWSKTGGWCRVEADTEAASFLDGVPKGAEELRLIVGENGGFVAEGRLGRSRPLPVAVVVNCCHGGPGEDGTLQGAFDLAGLRYSGPAVAGAALGMDKLAFGGVVGAAGLPTLPRRCLDARTLDVGFPGPYIVKPRFGGSSIGVQVVQDVATARHLLTADPHLREGAVIEPYRPDLFDLNVGVRSWPTLELSAVERPLRADTGGEILGYADKYVGSEGMASAPRELPANIPVALRDALFEASTVVAGLVSLRGVARVDFLSDGEVFFVNEVNTIPGSLSRHLWVDPLVPFPALLDGLIDEALSRPTARRTTVGADGTVLRAAGGIAAKLA